MVEGNNKKYISKMFVLSPEKHYYLLRIFGHPVITEMTLGTTHLLVLVLGTFSQKLAADGKGCPETPKNRDRRRFFSYPKE